MTFIVMRTVSELVVGRVIVIEIGTMSLKLGGSVAFIVMGTVSVLVGFRVILTEMGTVSLLWAVV